MFNSLPNDTILGMFKFKASVEDKFGVAEIMGFVLEMVENIVGKGENAGYQHFLHFPTMFSKGFLPLSLEVWIVWLRVNFITGKTVLCLKIMKLIQGLDEEIKMLTSLR